MSASNPVQSLSLNISGISQKRSVTGIPVKVSDTSLSLPGNNQEQIPIEELQRLFEYDEEAGCLYWKQKPSRSKAQAGDRPGYITSHGYRCIGLRVQENHIRFYEHQAIWAMKYSYWPEEIDHINGFGLDNRLVNLREVSTQINRHNMKRYSNNTSGVTGVSWSGKYNKWRAVIKAERRQKHIGYFDSFEEAVAARKAAEAQYGYHPNHGRS